MVLTPPLFGQTWEWAGPFAVNPAVDVVALTDNRALFAAEGGKLYRYDNGNRNAALSEHFSLDFLAVDHVSSELAFAGGRYDSEISESNLWRSNDGGNSWLSMAPVNGDVRDIFFLDSLRGYVLTATALFETTDGGVAWAGVSLSGNLANGDLRAVLAREDGLLLVANAQGLFRKVSTGWEEAVSFALESELELQFAGDDAILLANGGFYEANDGDLAAWNVQSTWPTASTMSWVSEQTGVLANGQQLFRTTDGGDNWAQYGPSMTPEGDTLAIGQLAAASNSVAFAISSHDSSLWRSTDALTVGRSESAAIVHAIYPNPFSKQLTVELQDHVRLNRVALLNVQGQVVWSQSVTSTQHLHLNLPEVPPGVYFLRMQGDGVHSTQRLIRR